MKLIILLLFFLTSLNLQAEELKTIIDFTPPLEAEIPVADLFPEDFNYKAGLAVSSGAAAAFLGLTIYNSYQIADQALSNRTGREFQNGIILTGTFLISTAISVVFMDFFIEELQQKKDSISEE